MASTRSASGRRVVLYSAASCSLCDRAAEVLRDVCGDDFELIRIDGVPALEAAYRDSVPVIEIDGERTFAYFVEPDALRERLFGS